MYAVLHILAESLASDNLWPAVVFLTVLAIMAGLRVMGRRIAEPPRRRVRRVIR
jgi:hypothetical protein